MRLVIVKKSRTFDPDQSFAAGFFRNPRVSRNIQRGTVSSKGFAALY